MLRRWNYVRNAKVALVLVAVVALAVLAARAGLALVYPQHYYAEDEHSHEHYEECLEMREYCEHAMGSYVGHVHDYLEATDGCRYGSSGHMHSC